MRGRVMCSKMPSASHSGSPSSVALLGERLRLVRRHLVVRHHDRLPPSAVLPVEPHHRMRRCARPSEEVERSLRRACPPTNEPDGVLNGIQRLREGKTTTCRAGSTTSDAAMCPPHREMRSARLLLVHDGRRRTRPPRPGSHPLDVRRTLVLASVELRLCRLGQVGEVEGLVLIWPLRITRTKPAAISYDLRLHGVRPHIISVPSSAIGKTANASSVQETRRIRIGGASGALPMSTIA